MRLSAAEPDGENPPPAPAPIQYLIFEGGGPDSGPGRDAAANLQALRSKLGPVAPAAPRMYAYGVQQIRLLTRSARFLAGEIERALDDAERTGIPLWLHLDPLYAWGADLESRPEDAPAVKFWREPTMREWIEFPSAGQLPAYIPRPWFNWGPWCSPAPAVPAIGAPGFVEFACRQLREGILAPLQQRRRQWQRQGRDYLFAGINVGWEVHVPAHAQTLLGAGGEGAGVQAEYPPHVRGLKMDARLAGAQLGYASLHWRGWDESRLRAAARAQGRSRDEMFRQLCYESIHDYMEALARECHRHGLEPSRVYTHIVALATVAAPTTNHPPIWTAVNPYSTPGFTLDNKGAARFDFARLKQQLAEAPGYRGTGFGAIETYWRLGQTVYVGDEASCRHDLDEMFGHGANLQVIYAAFPFTAEFPPPAALQAARRWLEEKAR